MTTAAIATAGIVDDTTRPTDLYFRYYNGDWDNSEHTPAALLVLPATPNMRAHFAHHYFSNPDGWYGFFPCLDWSWFTYDHGERDLKLTFVGEQ